MANPENLSTPEDRGNNFSIELENSDLLFRVLSDRQFRNGFEWDEKSMIGCLGRIEMNDNLIEYGQLEIVGSPVVGNIVYQEYQHFCPSLKLKIKVVDDNYKLIDDRRYVKEAAALKIVEGLKNKGESAIYYVDSKGRQSILIPDGGLTYVINMGFIDEEKHFETPFPIFTINERYKSSMTDSKFDIFCVKININHINKDYMWVFSSCDWPGLVAGQFGSNGFSIEDKNKFKKDMTSFFEKCGIILSSLYEAYGQALPTKNNIITCFEDNQSSVSRFKINSTSVIEESLKLSEQILKDRDGKFISFIEQSKKELSENGALILFASDLNIRMIDLASDGLDDKGIRDLIYRTIEMKVNLCKSNGVKWMPVNTQDFINAISCS